MMWNGRYGMMRGYPGGTSRVALGVMGGAMMGGGGDDGRLERLVRQRLWQGHLARPGGPGRRTHWLGRLGRASTPRATAEHSPATHPDTIANGKTAGMLSVNARTGTVWYHGWRSEFRQRASIQLLSAVRSQPIGPEAQTPSMSPPAAGIEGPKSGVTRRRDLFVPGLPEATRSLESDAGGARLDRARLDGKVVHTPLTR